MNNYQNLEQHFRRLTKYEHLQAICGWDQAAMMPSGASQARAEAMAELAVLMHNLNTDPSLGQWLDGAKSEALTASQQQSLYEMHKRWQQATVLPAQLVEAKALAGAKCEHAWRTQRGANDWQGFSANLKEVVALSREEASLRAATNNSSRYDAMMDLFEPGMQSAEIERVFSQVKTWLPELIDQALERQQAHKPIKPEGVFAIEAQKALGLKAMTLLGFDFAHGRLDVSTHPFCGGVPSDVRITTRYDEQDFMSALQGVIHETGHARYEQNLPGTWAGLPVGQARSMGVHESQSLFFEMQLARSREFSALLAPMAAEVFGRGGDPAFAADNFYRLSTQVHKGFIRVNADEATYPAHIILRFEIERALIDGDIEVHHIPDLWNEKMQQYLGLNTEGNYKDGCMQDIHWTDGAFGYFPSYTLGAMYAAQEFAAAERAIPNLREKIGRGELNELFNWLRENIWQKASTLPTAQLMQEATGEPLNPDHFKRHLQQRYLQD